MAFDLASVESLAPDQASLTAASKLAKPEKWLSLARDGELWWGECQGSGANPYRTVVDSADTGYKCTCPSRKFPCKHSLALMWVCAKSPELFGAADVPAWVTDWMGRRRVSAPEKKPTESKSIALAESAGAAPEAPAPPDPARAKQQAKTRENTRAMIADGLDDLDQWIADQLKAGLLDFVTQAPERCRRIAARLVDNKAAAMASRLDELPARLLAVPVEERPDVAVREFGKLVLLTRAWRADPDEPQAARDVGPAERRDDILANPDAPRVTGRWEVLGEQLRNRRDGLVSHSTWFLRVGESQAAGVASPAGEVGWEAPVGGGSAENEPSSPPSTGPARAVNNSAEDGRSVIGRETPAGNSSGTAGPAVGRTPLVALLLDYYPATAGRQEASFVPGAQYDATMVFYPGPAPLRALAVDMQPVTDVAPWPPAPHAADPLTAVALAEDAVPWQLEHPLLLPAGRIVDDGKSLWWVGSGAALPLADGAFAGVRPQVLGIAMDAMAAVWDGSRLTPLAAQTPWGRGGFTS